MIFSRRRLLGGVAACGAPLKRNNASSESLAIIAGVGLKVTSEVYRRAVYFVEPMAFAWRVINPFGVLDGHSTPEGLLVRYIEPHGWVGFDPISYPGCDFAIELIEADEVSMPMQTGAIALIVTSPPCHHEHSVNRLIERLTKVARRHAVAHGFTPIKVTAVKIDSIGGEEGNIQDDAAIVVNVDGLNQGNDIWKINAHIGEYLRKPGRI